jgi:putative ABC transport system substrate-binding protein
MDVRAAGNVDRMRTFARELVGLGPNLILGSTTALMALLQRETRATPIVFAAVSDRVGDGLVASLPRSAGNITGFTYVKAEMASKWPELLTEIAPSNEAQSFSIPTPQPVADHIIWRHSRPLCDCST